MVVGDKSFGCMLAGVRSGTRDAGRRHLACRLVFGGANFGVSSNYSSIILRTRTAVVPYLLYRYVSHVYSHHSE